MKKTLLSIAIIISAASQAQTLTQANSAPVAGNSYTTYQCDSTGISAGASGAGQTWNFSSIITHSSIAKAYISSVNSNTVYAPADVYVNSTTSPDNSYYKSTSSDLKYYGGNFMISTFAVSLTYTVPSIKAIYPMSLNTTTSSAVSGSVTLNGSVNGTFTGNSGVTADATGTLVLAGKTFTDVIRVVTTQVLNASLSIGTGTVTQLTYDYYSAAAAKAPIFSISTSTIVSFAGTSTQTLVTILKDYPTASINEAQQANTELNVFPNPSSSFVNFNTTNVEATKVIAYDLTGKMVVSELIEFGKAKMNVHTLSNGLYLYTVIGKNNQVLTTGKFNVSK